MEKLAKELLFPPKVYFVLKLCKYCQTIIMIIRENWQLQCLQLFLICWASNLTTFVTSIYMCEVVISVILSEHNSGTPWLICLQFLCGSLDDHRNILFSKFVAGWVYFLRERLVSMQSWVPKLLAYSFPGFEI